MLTLFLCVVLICMYSKVIPDFGDFLTHFWSNLAGFGVSLTISPQVLFFDRLRLIRFFIPFSAFCVFVLYFLFNHRDYLLFILLIYWFSCPCLGWRSVFLIGFCARLLHALFHSQNIFQIIKESNFLHVTKVTYNFIINHRSYCTIFSPN